MEIEKNLKKHENPGITADVIVNFKGLGIILVKRAHNPYKDFWALPGGFLETGKETIRDAGGRELLEETSLAVDKEGLGYLGFYDDPNRDPRGHIISHVFFADVQDGEPKADDDAKEIGIFPLNNLPLLAFDHQKIIDDYRIKKVREERLI